MQRGVLMVTLAAFTALSGVALWQHGLWGIVGPLVQTSAGLQVLCDLTIALVLVLQWIRRDAKAHGRAVWPWVILTLALGSFGPLIYLLTRHSKAATRLSEPVRN
jgi:hypothetical protein